MGEKMKSLDKMIKERLYAEVYEVLATDNFVYSYENLQKAFPKADSMQYYCFLMYSISKEETTEKHLAVCNLLAFGEPLLDDIYTLINWHINRTLSLFPAFTPIKSFAVYIFFHCPDSPISEGLLYEYALSVLQENPDDSLSKELIDEFEKRDKVT